MNNPILILILLSFPFSMSFKSPVLVPTKASATQLCLKPNENSFKNIDGDNNKISDKAVEKGLRRNSFDPFFIFSSPENERNFIYNNMKEPSLLPSSDKHISPSPSSHENAHVLTSVVMASTVFFFILSSSSSLAQDITSLDMNNIFDPAKFQPVCPASDTLYQVLKGIANSLVGSENVIEYGPLIAGVLLRVRLELCVLESFLYEAVIPFIQQKGLSWVLPVHETLETFLAGTIFSIASNFILLGSTKIISVLFIYADALTGFPARILGGGIKKASPGNSAGDAIGSTIKIYGDILGTLRRFLENVDTFVGRYLVVTTTIYIAFKFAHYKLFNDLF